MANLDETAASLKVELSSKKKISNSSIVTTSGIKRRSWLNDEAEGISNIERRSGAHKGSIDPVYEPRSSTPFMNPVNGPNAFKGSMKAAYRPLSLSLDDLRGNPLKVVQYLYELYDPDTAGITIKIRRSNLIRELGISEDSAKTALKFLVKNSVIERMEFKVGKMGWTKYKIKELIFNELERDYKKGLIDPIKKPSENAIQKGSNSSSSILLKDNTTTSLPSDWKNINFQSLTSLGFSESQLKQIYEINITTPELVQDSINRFAYSIDYNEKTKSYPDPLNVFMGVMRKGQRWNEPNYISPKDLALKQLLDDKKKEQVRRDEMIKELIDLDFPKWRSSLTEEQVKQIVPESVSNTKIPAAVMAVLRTYYRDNVILPKINGSLNESSI